MISKLSIARRKSWRAVEPINEKPSIHPQVALKQDDDHQPQHEEDDDTSLKTFAYDYRSASTFENWEGPILSFPAARSQSSFNEEASSSSPQEVYEDETEAEACDDFRAKEIADRIKKLTVRRSLNSYRIKNVVKDNTDSKSSSNSKSHWAEQKEPSPGSGTNPRTAVQAVNATPLPPLSPLSITKKDSLDLLSVRSKSAIISRANPPPPPPPARTNNTRRVPPPPPRRQRFQNEDSNFSLSSSLSGTSAAIRRKSINSLSASMPNVFGSYHYDQQRNTRFAKHEEVIPQLDTSISRSLSVGYKRAQSFNENNKYSKSTNKSVLCAEPDVNESMTRAINSPPADDKGLLNKIPSFLRNKVRAPNVQGDGERDSRDALKRKPLTHDTNGRCLVHPSIIIAKKRPFAKGWIVNSCPRCSTSSTTVSSYDSSKDTTVTGGVEEILAQSQRTYDWQDTIKQKNTTGRIEGADEFLASSRSFQMKGPPNDRASALSEQVSQLLETDRPSRGRRFSPPYSSPSTKPPKSSSGSREVKKIQHKKSLSRHEGSSTVSKLPFKTPWGESGSYSGAVNEVGIPHGYGRMRFKNGDVHEGQWSNGYSEQFIEKSSRMKRGFCENRPTWKENMMESQRQRMQQSFNSSLTSVDNDTQQNYYCYPATYSQAAKEETFRRDVVI
ncbi:predicted protein [Thalassiosira pseudonana CCMP1335]|jgi:hypothetical protein|uniref:Uncharacterized protein n=1 Tax=Thalassiosira pseudonana TaxID=35128 RepID=B8C7W3_THAPS|nr:predicted protein [Thalassiosira pseudonana CCMP1335]EED90180.1 predicted protein [Thalassiosira pseudonana CCMP1335]|eukprot:scaffold114_cov200-Alexandrium_tamarense.AAC.37